MILWLKITKDKYQLPLAIGGSCYELSKLTGASVKAITMSARRWDLGQVKRPGFIKVYIDDEE